tara:strand:+ start:338 stop:637 length:300 start_codon:yes stop_codon:yes gene_type:complete
MANVIPQSPKVNRYTWIKAEKLERQVASKLGSLDVLIGVIYSDIPQRIGKNKIAVPKAYYKKLSNREHNYEKCFYYENELVIDTKKDKLRNHLIECSKL